MVGSKWTTVGPQILWQEQQKWQVRIAARPKEHDSVQLAGSGFPQRIFTLRPQRWQLGLERHSDVWKHKSVNYHKRSSGWQYLAFLHTPLSVGFATHRKTI